MQVEILIIERPTVDALASCAILVSEVATLCHETRDDAMEGATKVVEMVAIEAHTFVSFRQSDEIIDSAWDDITEEAEDDSTRALIVN